ncbi:17186_t:CDS:2, partial [Funneliformis geosporum]
PRRVFDRRDEPRNRIEEDRFFLSGIRDKTRNKELEEDNKALKSKLTASQTSWFRQKLPFVGKEKQSKVVALNSATVLSNKNNNSLPIIPIIGVISASKKEKGRVRILPNPNVEKYLLNISVASSSSTPTISYSSIPSVGSQVPLPAKGFCQQVVLALPTYSSSESSYKSPKNRTTADNVKNWQKDNKNKDRGRTQHRVRIQQSDSSKVSS